MSEDEAIRKASAYAERHGYAPAQYDVSAGYVEGTWRVSFQGRELRPGNFFTVVVNDASGAVKKLVPGK